jgi:hypothetical protein
VSRFIDDISNLAIEDCLISKLPTLFRSNNVLEMSSEDISRLAGETRASSLERKRLEAKRKILQTGLQGMKSLHKRSTVVDGPPKQDEVASEDSEKMSVMSRSRPEKASTATYSAEAAPLTIRPDKPSEFQDRVIIRPAVDEWPPQAETHGEMEDDWDPLLSKKGKKKASKYGMAEEPPIDGGWGY